MINNRIIAIVLKSIFLVIGLLGIFISFRFPSLLFYTYQSNLLVIGYLIFSIIVLLVRVKNEGISGSVSVAPRLNVCVTLAITVTFLVYWSLLARDLSTLFAFKNLAVHAFVPLFMIADYVLFNENGHLKKYDPLVFVAVPIFYFIQATILGFAGVVYAEHDGVVSYFPYFFIDYYKIGVLMVIVYVLIISAFFIGLSYLMFLIDKKWQKRIVGQREET